MKTKRLPLPLAAAVGALLIGGVSVAMATDPSAASNPPAASNAPSASVAEPVEAPGTESAETPGVEADGPGGHEDPAGNVDHQFEGAE